MKTLHVGFDQAFANSGYAVVEYEHGSRGASYVESGVFHPSIKMGHASDAIAFLEHSKFIKDLLYRISKKHGEIRSIGIEGVAIGAVGQASARGGIFGVYSLHALKHADLIVVSPKKLKSYWTNNGGAEKEDVFFSVCGKYPGVEGVLRSKYDGKNAEERKRVFDETDALGIATVGLNAWRVLNFGMDSVKEELDEIQKKILWCDAEVKKKHKTSPTKYFGICNRIDDFYIRKRG